MREIKFRAWDKKWDRWISPDDICYRGPDDWTFDRRSEPDGDIIETTELKHEEIALQQYTGLKDKNGNEIYEGDILQYIGLIFPVSVDAFHGYRFMHGLDQLTKAIATHGAILGNLYENPELLK